MRKIKERGKKRETEKREKSGLPNKMKIEREKMKWCSRERKGGERKARREVMVFNHKERNKKIN